MPHRLGLTEAAELIRTRRLSTVETVEACLAQIEKTNSRINAFVEIYAAEARAQARDLERREPEGPLYGVPVTVKDSFDMEGCVTACGSRLRAGSVAQRDATAVARLKSAGAIVIGRTNTPEFLSTYETDNHITGRTNNPWNPERTSGGSSGGEAASIAALCSYGGIGSDGGGSIRQPAHFCGIAGLKPTPGRVPAAGHWPEICHPGGFMGVAGPMARTAADVQALFAVLSGHDPRDPFSVPIPLRAASLDGLRVEVMEQFNEVPVQPALREAVAHCAGLLSSMRIPVEPFDSSIIRRSPNLWLFLFGELPAALLQPMLEGRRSDCHWTGLEFFSKYEGQPAPPAAKIAGVFLERDRMRAELLTRMGEHTVILAPACGVTAFPHRARRYKTGGKEIGLFEAVMPLVPWNLLGMPSLAIPMNFDEDGMPAGVQLIGPPYAEELLLRLAVELEEIRGKFPHPPLALE